MDKRFKNNYLAKNVKTLINSNPNMEPIVGDIGGYSIELTNVNDQSLSHDSFLYKDAPSRDADIKLLLTLLK